MSSNDTISNCLQSDTTKYHPATVAPVAMRKDGRPCLSIAGRLDLEQYGILNNSTIFEEFVFPSRILWLSNGIHPVGGFDEFGVVF